MLDIKQRIIKNIKIIKENHQNINIDDLKKILQPAIDLIESA